MNKIKKLLIIGEISIQQNKKVVILGGGTGTSCIVRGLKYFPIDLTCVITVSDDGSSTGRLRKEFDTPAVSDK